MDIYYVLSVIVFVIYLQFGVFILLKNPPSEVNQCLLVLSLFFSLWSLAVVFLEMARSVTESLLVPPLTLLAWSVLPFFLIRIHMRYMRFPGKQTHRLLIYTTVAVIGVLLLFYHILHAYEVVQTHPDPSVIFPLPRTLIMIQIVYICLFALAVFSMIVITRKRIKLERSVASVRFFSYSFAVFLLLAVFLDIIPLYREGAYIDRAYTHIFAMPWLGAFAYAVLGKRLYFFIPGSASQIVLQNVQYVLFLCDARGMIIESNDFAARLLQISQKRLYASRLLDYIADNRQHISQAFAKALEEGASGPHIVRIQSYSGQLSNVRMSFRRIIDIHDDLQGVMVSAHSMLREQSILNDIQTCSATMKELNVKNKALKQGILSCTYDRDRIEQKYIGAAAKHSDTEDKIKTGIMAKEVLISEIYNRVKGNMNMISSLIQIHINEDSALAAEMKLSMLLQRIESILLLHESLYLSLRHPEIDFRQYLDLLENNIQKRLEESFQIVKNIDCDYIEMDRAITLGLVVDELIINALIHAFPNSHRLKLLPGLPVIQIDYYETEGSGHLSVRDNGIGLPEGLSMKDLSTHGLPLVDMLIREQLDGSIDIGREEAVTQIRIRFPLS